jgi:hypothetical protein
MVSLDDALDPKEIKTGPQIDDFYYNLQRRPIIDLPYDTTTTTTTAATNTTSIFTHRAAKSVFPRYSCSMSRNVSNRPNRDVAYTTCRAIPALRPSYRLIKPCFFNISDSEKLCPLADAKFDRTAIVLNGCTTAQPKHPPNPDVVKITHFGNGCDFAVAGGGCDVVVVVVVASAAGDVAR